MGGGELWHLAMQQREACLHQPGWNERVKLPLEPPPHEEQRDQHAHANQLECTGSICLRAASLPPRAQAFLLEGMLDGLATIGLRPRWRYRDERQLRHHPHMGREMIEHAQDAEQGIGALL